MSRRKQQWRVQVDQYPTKGSKISETRTIIESHPKDRDYAENILLPGTEVDEIVIHGFFHLEQMTTRSYWMNVGGLTVNVQLGRDGKPSHVRWELDNPVDGCEYGDGT